MIDSMRDGSLPLADIGDDGYLTFDEFAEFHNLGDEEYFYTVYSLYNELSWIFESTRGFTPQELFNITDSDVNGFITLEEFFYLGTEFENDLEFYWDYCEYNAESDDYMCWLSDWELDDSGEKFIPEHGIVTAAPQTMRMKMRIMIIMKRMIMTTQ
jgi:hypothetical protein